MPAPRFWQFAHLTDSTKNMGWLDRIPRATTGHNTDGNTDGDSGGNLYIGGLHALYSHPHLLREAKVSHILSVIDFDISTEGNGAGTGNERGSGGGVLEGYQHLMIREDDEPNANLLQHFERTNQFIEEGLRDGTGSGVFVHCAMGKSRSATVCCAYLMWKYNLSPQEALRWVCEGRAVCSPNPGFMEQLGAWRRMLDAGDGTEREGVYKEWEVSRFKGEYWEWEKRGKGAKL
ncbi:hypothetical protein KC332_g12448 [Hortaea werneckii]|uniref:Uncharacterized protein n=2 Tax=Hortaea werneckii TaxID=91943 RepID=A0A3M7I275_HORWE|nr:hypothetical protein KC350_g14255 [Hortaea werneckii]OTA37528.1 hypothetical protein BTJ68_02818 [Hortaea werneckii EXF-2000]KAI6810325.1 hypothetical protein KC358_g12381 [Hortaea werneckii]KAI6904816.1 hypothetical protein KC348_g15172 [Hortaea werneckii]KAI6927307.1 hypothetical protein KC341_g12205 [Hortaea werneckii]